MTTLSLSKYFIVLATILSFGSATAFAYFDPGLQRWINRDPIEENGFESIRNCDPSQKRLLYYIADIQISRNMYAYVNDNPISLTDYLGLASGYLPTHKLPPYDPSNPEKPSKRRVCRLLVGYKPASILNPGTIKCWRCIYQCEGEQIGNGGTHITRYLIGGCPGIFGFVPGFDDPIDCEGAIKNCPPRGIPPHELE